MTATTQFRLLILKLAAVAASLIAGGCSMPPISVTPQPQKPVEPQQVQLKITVDGSGQINVAGGADVNVKSAANGSASADRCDCGCHQDDSRCSGCSLASLPSKPTADTSARSGPHIVTQKVYQCRNGVCGWYDVPVVAIQPKQTKRVASSTSGRIRVYLQPNYLDSDNASLAMRRAVGEASGIEWVYGQPPAVNGRAMWPTAVKADGSAWQSGDWDGSSLARFTAWANQ